MTLATNLSVSPYYDTFDVNKNRHQVLFQPGVSVQISELNELQSILQNQIERFGDNVFKSGTIISGCAMSFNSNYAYIKIADNTVDGTQAVPANYVGCYVYNANGLCGIVQNYINGYQSTDPNLKTLYINYINSGYNYKETSFKTGDVLRVTDANNSLRSVTINNPGTQFTNSDSLQIVSAITVDVSTTATFTNGEIITCASSNKQAQVYETNTTAIPGSLVLKINPVQSDLANTLSSNSIWTFSNNSSIYGVTSGATGTITKTVGNTASGQIVTDGSGRIVETVITNPGYGYIVPPYVTVKPTQTTSGLAILSLIGKNYLDDLIVPSANSANGFGYAMTISNGVIYQQGYFIAVGNQTVIVNNYSQQPNNVAVVFDITESLIKYNIDNTLLDPFNNQAPGADRLVLTPVLTVVNTSITETTQTYLPLVTFNNGVPSIINQTTQYNVLQDEMATRTMDEAGNFALDQFIAVSTSTSNTTNEGNTVSIVIDTGKAYIDGYLVQSNSNYSIDIRKGIDTLTSNGVLVSIDYDNYIRISEVGGYFQFSTGDMITLYDSNKSFISNTSYAYNGNTNPVGYAIGSAYLKNMVLESGVPGTNTAIYRLYIFNVSMNSGTNFSNTRSVYYTNGSLSGIADIVLSQNSITSSNVAMIYGNSDTSLYQTNLPTINSTNNITYLYRTVNTAVTVANTGVAVISLLGSSNEVFDYSTVLSNTQLQDLYVVPQNGIRYGTQITGSNTIVASSNTTLTGTTTAFITDLNAGDYVYINNNSNLVQPSYDVKKVTQIVNNYDIVLDSNLDFTSSNVSVYRYFPGNVPIPFGNRSGFSANLTSNNNILNINFGSTLAGTTSANVTVGYTVQKNNASPGTKTPNRDISVVISTSNNVAGNNGPWCIGVPDIFRLRSVKIASNTSSWSTATDVTNYFYIDSNQQGDYNGLGYLYLDPKYSYGIPTASFLLVTFDAYTGSGSFYTATSYISSNTAQQFAVEGLTLANLGSQVSAWEVPEFYTNDGVYHDLLNEIDFRIAAQATATLTSNTSLATVNPSEVLSFGNTSSRSDLKTPLPASLLSADINFYSGRVDSLIVDQNGSFSIISGPVSQSNYRTPSAPKNSLLINNFVIPPFPTVAQNPTSTVLQIINTNVVNGKVSTVRPSKHAVKSVLTQRQINTIQPTGYSMADIAALENRIKALEYNASLSALEASVTNQNIPSSILPINRYVFGFYVDDFSTTNNLSLSDPQFAATPDTKDKVLLPKQFNINLPHGVASNMLYHPDYIEYPVVSQLSATYDPENPPAPCLLDLTDPTVIIAQTRQQSNPTVGGTASDTQPDVLNVTMSTTNGPAAIYFYTYSGYADITISQNGNIIATSNNAIPLTSSDVSELANNAYFQDSSINLSTSFFNLNANGYVSGCGKIMFNHNATLGSNYTIEVDKGLNSALWRYLIEYPIDSSKYVDCQVDTGGTPLPPPPPPPPPVVTPPAPPPSPPAPTPAPADVTNVVQPSNQPPPQIVYFANITYGTVFPSDWLYQNGNYWIPGGVTTLVDAAVGFAIQGYGIDGGAVDSVAIGNIVYSLG